MIKRIELINFMSHAHTVIEPAMGLTVLVGPNNCGKSAVLSALQILAHNDTSTYVTRHGEKECSIIVETSEGDVIQWTRRRSTTKYIVNGKIFDRLKGKVPDEVNQILRLPTVKLDQSNDEFDIHFGHQKKPVFLINESGRAAAGFFAASSDASRLIEMQKLHKQKTTEAARDLARLEEEQKLLDRQTQRLESVPSITAAYQNCEQLRKSIEIHETAIDQIRVCVNKIQQTRAQQYSFTQQFRTLTDLNEPPALSATQQLVEFVDEISNNQKRRLRLQKQVKALANLSAPTPLHDTDNLGSIVKDINHIRQKLERAKIQNATLCELTSPPQPTDLAKLNAVIGEIVKTERERLSLQSKLSEIAANRQLAENELRIFTDSNPVCPTCHQTVSSETIIKSTLEQNDG